MCVCVRCERKTEAKAEWEGGKRYLLYVCLCFSIIPVAFLINFAFVCVCREGKGGYSVCNFTLPLYFLYFHYSGPRQTHRGPNAEQMFTSDTRWNMWKMCVCVCVRAPGYGLGPQSLCSPAIMDRSHPGVLGTGPWLDTASREWIIPQCHILIRALWGWQRCSFLHRRVLGLDKKNEKQCSAKTVISSTGRILEEKIILLLCVPQAANITVRGLSFLWALLFVSAVATYICNIWLAENLAYRPWVTFIAVLEQENPGSNLKACNTLKSPARLFPELSRATIRTFSLFSLNVLKFNWNLLNRSLSVMSFDSVLH